MQDTFLDIARKEIIEAMEEREVTAYKLAQIVFKKPSEVSNMYQFLKGTRSIGLIRLEKICLALDLELTIKKRK